LNPRGQRWVAHRLFFVFFSCTHVYVDKCSVLGSALLVGCRLPC
jgi:hypothetical protein